MEALGSMFPHCADVGGSSRRRVISVELTHCTRARVEDHVSPIVRNQQIITCTQIAKVFQLVAG